MLAAALSVIVLATSGVLWFGYRHLSAKIGRVNAIGGSTVADVDGRDQNILIVGTDDRSDATPAELKALGTTANAGVNTDTMMLIHVPANGKRATAVSFPRDSWVNIPGVGMDKLNSAYAHGAFGGGGKANPDRGRQLLVRTVSELTGLRVDHYVEVDLLGFYRISNAIGGVQVCLKQPAKDPFSGIDLPAGRSTIKGTQALAFVRQRHGLPNGDLDRIVRQQYFLSAAFRKMKSVGVVGNPVKLTRLLDAIGSSVRMDRGLDPLQLARQVEGLAAGNIDFRTLPNKGTATVEGRSVVLVDTNALPAFFRSVIGSSGTKPAAAKTVPRSQVNVAVLNGAGRRGLATQTASQLRSAGFTVTGTGNASSVDRTVVQYAPGRDAEARTLAALIPGAELQQKDGLGGSVQLVLGANFAGVRTGSGGGSSGGSSAASPPSTAAAPAASSSSAPARTAADAGCIN
jgi:LCP family protein required for cell wall assembly